MCGEEECVRVSDSGSGVADCLLFKSKAVKRSHMIDLIAGGSCKFILLHAHGDAAG